MCGICGSVWNCSNKAIALPILKKMTDVLYHRGPDDGGVLYKQMDNISVALGHRRLSILDISYLGHQPMFNEDETIAIVFNGEIYNFLELRQNLIQKGHQFRSHTDTEVLIHLYEERGESMFEYIHGMFAMAIWDSKHEKLLLGRDRLGKKPLLYFKESGRFLFASELKSLLQVPEVSRTIDPVALDEYFTYQYIPHPRTIFQGIMKLLPGHFAVLQNDQLTISQYWKQDFNEEEKMSYEDCVSRLDFILNNAIKIRMQSDVPLGVFLSGGIDSTIVTGLLQKHSTQKINTFSIGFYEKKYDESTSARIVAEYWGTNHREFFITPDIIDTLPKILEYFDEPFGDSSIVPLWYLCREARQYVTVVLSGDGGDELFAGYERYKAIKIASYFDSFPYIIRQKVANLFLRFIPESTQQGSFLRAIKRLLEVISNDGAKRYLTLVGLNQYKLFQIYTNDFIQKLSQDSLSFLQKATDQFVKRDTVSTASFVDIQTYLPCDGLVKTDMTTMAHSLECRSPLLDQNLLDLISKMPIQYKLRMTKRGLIGKWILRNTFHNLIPQEINLQKKKGFTVPLATWFRGSLKNYLIDVLLNSNSLSIQNGYFQRSSIEQIIKDHIENRCNNDWLLWSLLIFELWYQRWGNHHF
jgi:asparagine synthase (glutamine-hydrolysing)